MTPAELLRAARERIADKEHWAQGRLAVDARNREVPPNDPRAERWCAIGALCRVADAPNTSRLWTEPGAPRVYGHLIAAAEDELGNAQDSLEAVMGINDGPGHRAVLRLYDRAIALCEKQEADHG